MLTFCGQSYDGGEVSVRNPFTPNTEAHRRYECCRKFGRNEERDGKAWRRFGESYMNAAYERGRYEMQRELNPDSPLSIIAC